MALSLATSDGRGIDSFEALREVAARCSRRRQHGLKSVLEHFEWMGTIDPLDDLHRLTSRLNAADEEGWSGSQLKLCGLGEIFADSRPRLAFVHAFAEGWRIQSEACCVIGQIGQSKRRLIYEQLVAHFPELSQDGKPERGVASNIALCQQPNNSGSHVHSSEDGHAL